VNIPHDGVAALMRDVGRDVLMRYFRALVTDQIVEKSPGDFVTIADNEAEARLTEGLMRLLPGSHVVGEEACAANPVLVRGVTCGISWIVDPLDGTGNFASGETPFACMVALAVEGVVEGGWILDPATGRLCHAVRGGGAFIDNERVEARGTGAALPVAALVTRFLPAALHAPVRERARGHLTEVPIPRCAGEQYPRLVLGQNDIALFWNANPWDHAPGALFLQEAGGRIARLDGSPYRLGDDRTGLLAAASSALWDQAAAALLGEPLPPA